MARVMLTVTEDERDALVKLAKDERRDPRAQGSLILRAALERAGYLTPNTNGTKREASYAQ